MEDIEKANFNGMLLNIARVREVLGLNLPSFVCLQIVCLDVRCDHCVYMAAKDFYGKFGGRS